MISPVPRTHRRGALWSLAAAAVVVPTLAACDATDTTPRRSGVEPTADAARADAALVDALTPRIASLRVSATDLARRAPASRDWALDLAALHQRHLAKLGGGTTGRSTSVLVRTPAALVSLEEGLQKALVTAALRAESGALAQVLASMAAAVEQRLVAR